MAVFCYGMKQDTVAVDIRSDCHELRTNVEDLTTLAGQLQTLVGHFKA